MIPTKITKAILFGTEVQTMSILIAQSKASEWGELDSSYRQAKSLYEEAKQNYPEEWVSQFMTPLFEERKEN